MRFARQGAPIKYVLPTFVRNAPSYSRERSDYFKQDQEPSAWGSAQVNFLREIELPLPNDGMVRLLFCYVKHKVGCYNHTSVNSTRETKSPVACINGRYGFFDR